MNVYKSARNIPQVSVSPVSDLNALSVLQPRRMLVTQGGAGFDPQQARRAAVASGRSDAIAAARAVWRIGMSGRWVKQRQHRKSGAETKLQLEPHQVILRPLVTEKGMHRATRTTSTRSR